MGEADLFECRLRDVRFGIGHRAWGMESEVRGQTTEDRRLVAEAIFFRYALSAVRYANGSALTP